MFPATESSAPASRNASPGRPRTTRASRTRLMMALSAPVRIRLRSDGYVLIVDEWESVEQFQTFMSDPDLQAFIGSVGGAPEPPEVIVARAISSPDEF
jgi:hypothetical protein